MGSILGNILFYYKLFEKTKRKTKLNYNIHHGTQRINKKIINGPINNLIGTCSHSDCKTKCGSCLEIDTTHPINTLPETKINI